MTHSEVLARLQVAYQEYYRLCVDNYVEEFYELKLDDGFLRHLSMDKDGILTYIPFVESEVGLVIELQDLPDWRILTVFHLVSHIEDLLKVQNEDVKSLELVPNKVSKLDKMLRQMGLLHDRDYKSSPDDLDLFLEMYEKAEGSVEERIDQAARRFRLSISKRC